MIDAVREEETPTLVDSEPEPDLAVMEARADEYRCAHASTARLVSEVAVCLARIDPAKAEVYAAASVDK